MKGAAALLARHEPLLVAAVFVATIFLNWNLVTAVLPRYALDFGVSVATAGLLLSAFTLGRVLFNFPAGAIVDRIGRRPMLVLGGLLVGVGSIGSGLVPGFSELLVLRFVTGAGGAIAIVAQLTILADIATPANRARLLSVNEGIVWVGVGFGPIVGGIIADAAGLRAPFYAVGAATLLVTAVAGVRMPETRTRHRADGTPQRQVPLREGLRTILTSRNYLMITVIGASSFATRFGTLFFLLPILACGPRFGLTLAEYGVLAGIAAAVQVALIPVVGVLADRLGRKFLIVPGTLVTGVGLLGYGLAPTREWLYAVAVVYALGSGFMGLAPGAYLADIAPAHLRGLSMGTWRTVGDLSGMISPIVLGALATAVNDPGIAIGANGVLVIGAGVAFAVLAGETHRST